MLPNPEFPADLVTLTKEIFTGKLHSLWSVPSSKPTGLSLRVSSRLHK